MKAEKFSAIVMGATIALVGCFAVCGASPAFAVCQDSAIPVAGVMASAVNSSEVDLHHEELHIHRRRTQAFRQMLVQARTARRGDDIETLNMLEAQLRLGIGDVDSPVLASEGYLFLADLWTQRKEYGFAIRDHSAAIRVLEDGAFYRLAPIGFLALGYKLQKDGYFEPALRCFEEVANCSLKGCSTNVIRATGVQIFLLMEMGKISEARALQASLDTQYGIQKTGSLAWATHHFLSDERAAAYSRTSLRYIEENAELWQDKDDSLSIRWMIARACFENDDFETASEHLSSLARDNYSQMGDEWLEIFRSQLDLELGEEQRGLDRLRAIIKEDSHMHGTQRAYDVLAHHYLKNDQSAVAAELLLSLHKYSKQYNTSVLSILSTASENSLNLRKRLNETELDRVLALQDKQRAVERNLDLSKETSRARITVFFALFGVCFLAGVVAMQLTFNQLRKEKRLKDLEKKHNEELIQVVNETSEALNQQVVERVELEKSLERKRRDEAIGKLTGNVAHDFNNLLQVIISTNEHLESQNLAFSEFDRDLISTSTKSAHIGASIVRQLLAFARQQILAPVSTPVDQYFDGTKDLLRAAVTRPSVLDIQVRCSTSRVKVDPTQLTTSLINLLTNALDAMPNGGKIQLIARHLGDSAEDAKQWREPLLQDHIAIEVIDQGKGLSEEEKRQVFEPFYSTKPLAAGTGLGLSSVLGFVRQSGGDVAIFDNEDRGLRVSMVFPMCSEEFEYEPKVTPNIDRAVGKVLVVEDDEYVAKSVHNNLGQLGFEAMWVPSGRDAIECLLDNDSFDAIVSDVRMPGDVSGIELRDWTRQNFPEIGFVLMSGYSYVDSHPERSIFLQKPFTQFQLSQAVRSELKERKMEQQRLRGDTDCSVETAKLST